MTSDVDELTGGIYIRWVAPYDNAQEITNYQIELLDIETNQWIEDSTYCDGSVIGKFKCLIPMSVARQTYSY